jgi:hypothetical protein
MSRFDVTQPFIFLRIAWMDNYKGIKKYDIPRGGGAMVDKSGTGGEVYNFLSRGAYTYGFVRVGKGKDINLRKLGAKNDEEFLEGVNIVFFARNYEFGHQYIIGGYKNATIYQSVQTIAMPNGKQRFYSAKCKSSDAILIPNELRSLEIEGPGQSNLFYAKNYTPKELQKIFDFIEKPQAFQKPTKKSNRTNGGSGWQLDAETRKMVEVAAMDFTSAHFEQKGFKIKDVHKQNEGWDLEAMKGKKILHLEVKGTQNSFVSVELTANEYKHFKSKKSTYRLCVVYYALDKEKITIDIIYHNGDSWVNSTGRQVLMKEAVSASISINK